jgi:SpoVK/Ycf46/Vps4 family AAA+-type ATPase
MCILQQDHQHFWTMAAEKKAAIVTIDPKLLHLVRKVLNASDSTKTEDVVTNLRSRHVEYQRKDIQILTAQVEAAVRQVVEGSISSRKRQAEALDEQAAAESDQTRELVGAGAGLNAALRNRYRQVQQGTVERAVETPPRTTEGGALNASASSKSNPEQGSSPKPKRRKNKTRVLPNGAASPFNDNAMNDSSFLTPVPRPAERFNDLGGMAETIRQIRQLVEYPVVRPELYRHLGVDPPRGVLLRGPPGTGKTHLANAGTNTHTQVSGYFVTDRRDNVSVL